MFYKYNVIDSVDKLKELDSFLMDGFKPKFDLLAFDTETNGLQLYKSVVIGFSIAVSGKQGFYIPFLRWKRDSSKLKKRVKKGITYDCNPLGCLVDVWTGKEYPEFVTSDEYQAPKLVLDYMKKWLTSTQLVMLNAPFDVNMTFINCGIELANNVFCDVGLLKHIINENTPCALKKIAEEWKEELGFNPYASANIEQQELIKSIIESGGEGKEVWRATLDYQAKYASSDAFLTYGVFEVGMRKFYEEFGEEKIDWFYKDEVMPLCREVIIPMKRLGVYVDVKHFKKLESETSKMLLQLEDKIIAHITPYLTNFTLGKSVEEAVSTQRLIKKIAEIEGVQLPINEKTQKETLAKADVKKEYQKNPHWLWAYILGESEIPYSDNKLNLIKQELFLEIEERRYAFNINSPRHLAWLFCEKLGVDAELLPQTASATKDNIIPSMEAEVLETSMLPKFEWVKDLLVYKKLAKAYSTYIAPALRLNIEGWVFVDWKQNGTVSGRFSCKGWNLQTLPKVEEEICPQCGNTDMEITPLIELLGSKKCTKCGYQEDNIILPSAIKKGFVAPKGMKFVNADYSSLEPRIFAFMSAEEKLKDVFRKGYDLYSQVYCDVVDFRKQYSANPEDENYLKKKNPAERVRIKPIVLGIVYGEKDGQVARLMGMVEKDGTPIYESGKLIRDSYLRAYPGLNQYMHKCEADCINKGYVETLIGRKRHFEFAPYVAKLILGKYFKDTKETHSLKKKLFDEFINTSNSKLNSPDVKIGNAIILTEEGLKELAKTFKIDYAKIVKKGYWGLIKNLAKQEYNNAKNIPIQGLASHVTNKASIEIARLLKKHNIEGYVCLQIHDEITLLVAEGQAEEAGKLLKQAMECNQYAKRLDVPMIAEPIICDNLKESK